MHKTEIGYTKGWQVGRGSESWDIGIAGLKYKGCPGLDIAMEYPTKAEIGDEADRNSPDREKWRTAFDNRP